MTHPNGTGRATHSLVERKVGDLSVDPNVQRGLKKARVQAIAADFHPEALGVLTTSYRSPGIIHVIDGQHRYRACEMANYEGAIQTMEYHGLTIQEEAALFRLLNQTEKVNPIDQFLVACVQEDPDALKLARIIADNGWTVAASASKGKLSAIASLRRVYDQKPHGVDAVAATLSVLTAAYGHQAAAVQGSLLVGVGRMLARYWTDGVDLNLLAKKLSGVPGGPDGLLGNARGQKLTRAGDLSTQVARIVTQVYNQGLRTRALPAWL